MVQIDPFIIQFGISMNPFGIKLGLKGYAYSPGMQLAMEHYAGLDWHIKYIYYNNEKVIQQIRKYRKQKNGMKIEQSSKESTELIFIGAKTMIMGRAIIKWMGSMWY